VTHLPFSGRPGALELGEVVSVNDPERLNRVEVRFLSRGPQAGDATNPDGEDATAWALVAVPFAGDGNGAFLIPDVGSRVVVSCLDGDPRYPVVLGAVWDGGTASPESLGGGGDAVDRWSFTGKAGTRVAIVEQGGGARIVLETPRGNRVRVDDSAGTVELRQGGSRVTLNAGGITLDSHTVTINAPTFSLSGAVATFDTPLATFSAFLSCQVMQSTTVVASAYTPGMGNML